VGDREAARDPARAGASEAEEAVRSGILDLVRAPDGIVACETCKWTVTAVVMDLGLAASVIVAGIAPEAAVAIISAA
jgi:hypothetical protein